MSKLEEEFKAAINDINSERLENVEEINTIKGWYAKTNEHKDRKEIVTKYIIPKLVEIASPYLSKIFIENLTEKSEFINDGIKSDLEFDLTPIKPYVDIILKANAAAIHSIRFTFQIDTHVYIKNLVFKKSKHLEISIGSMNIKLTLSLLKIVNDIEPLEIGSKEFIINNISLVL